MRKYIKKGFIGLLLVYFCLIGFCLGYNQQLFSQYEKGLDGIQTDSSPSFVWKNSGSTYKSYPGTKFFSFRQKINSIWEIALSKTGGIATGIYICWRDGFYIGKDSIIIYGYLLFALTLIFIIPLKKSNQKKLRGLFYIGLSLFLIIGMLNTIEYTLILKNGLNGFKNNMSFLELKDYYGFVDKIRDELDLDFNKKIDCKIYMEVNREYVNVDMFGPIHIYLKPCELDSTGNSADYKIYFKKEIPESDSDKQILLEYNGSYLLENKSK